MPIAQRGECPPPRNPLRDSEISHDTGIVTTMAHDVVRSTNGYSRLPAANPAVNQPREDRSGVRADLRVHANVVEVCLKLLDLLVDPG